MHQTMSYFKILLIDMLTLCMWSESTPACQISSDQTSRLTCLGQTEVVVDWSAVTSSRPYRWDVLQCVLWRQEAHSVELDGRKICWGLWSKSRLNSDLFLLLLSQSAGWWSRSPMAVFLPCRAAALHAAVDLQDGASPLVPAAQVWVFTADWYLI